MLHERSSRKPLNPTQQVSANEIREVSCLKKSVARGDSRILFMAQPLSKLQDHSRVPYYFLYSWWERGLRLSILFCEGIKRWDESAKSRKANSNDFTTYINFFREETNAISTIPVFPISTDISGDFIGSLPSLRRRNRHKRRSPNGNGDNFGYITYSLTETFLRKSHYSFEIITGVVCHKIE